jgi:hypothetical protein
MMSNIAELQHLGFEKSHDGTEVIVSINLHGAPIKARLSHHRGIIALAELIEAVDEPLRKEFIRIPALRLDRPVPPLDPADLAHAHPGEPSSPNPAPDAPRNAAWPPEPIAQPPPAV